MDEPVRVAIVGCGLIGSAWDEGDGTPGVTTRTAPRTHAAAFAALPDARLVGCCDADRARADAAAACWSARSFTDVSAMLSSVAADLVVIATPASTRLQTVGAALAAGVRTFVIEKPLAPTLAEAEALAAALDDAGARALVNYTRHWDPSMHALRARLRNGEAGPMQRAVAQLGKGSNHSGSHMIDLVSMLCDAQPVAARAQTSPLDAAEADWSAGADPMLDGQVRLATTGGGTLQLDMLATDCRAFTEFRLRLIGRDASVELSLGGRRIDWTPVIDDPDFPGYRIPGDAQPLAADARLAMASMAADALRLARDPAHRPACDLHTALRTARAVQAMRDSQRDGGPWCPLPDAHTLPLKDAR